jgi:hypothetical protein
MVKPAATNELSDRDVRNVASSGATCLIAKYGLRAAQRIAAEMHRLVDDSVYEQQRKYPREWGVAPVSGVPPVPVV